MEYLPIGSVVLLKDGIKKVMITGYVVRAKEDKEKIYDYCGCLFPEGYLSGDKVCMFDHDQISEVCFLGFKNDEQKEFLEKLSNFISNVSNKNKGQIDMLDI